MIPQNTYQTTSEIGGNRDYRLLGEHMGGLTQGVDALKGWIALALSTERYAYPVFSPAFGIELVFTKTQPNSAIERAIIDALSQDERILRVRDFTITREGGKVSAAFTVDSVYGAFETETLLYV